jgi:hypothetical protein
MSKIIDWDTHIGRRLKLRDLHVFFTVVQMGSMAKAATHLRVTQPAVSQLIADLEHALGIKLLDRSSKGVEPTIYGRTLLRGSTAAIDVLKQTIKEIEFLSEEATGEVDRMPGNSRRNLTPSDRKSLTPVSRHSPARIRCCSADPRFATDTQPHARRCDCPNYRIAVSPSLWR